MVEINLTLTDEQLKGIKPILDRHNEEEPGVSDIKNWIYNMINEAIDNCPGYY